MQHFVERREAAVVHVGLGQRDVPQAWHLEHPSVCRVSCHGLQSGLQVLLVFEAVIRGVVKSRTEPAGQELAVTVDAVL